MRSLINSHRAHRSIPLWRILIALVLTAFGTIPPLTAMATVPGKVITFEDGSLTHPITGADNVIGTVVLDAASSMKGVYSADIPNVASGYLQEDFTGGEDVYVSFYMKVNVLPPSDVRFALFMHSGTNFGNLVLTQAGALRLRNDKAVIGADTAPLTVGTLYHVSLHQKQGTGGDAILEAYLAEGDAPFGAPFAATTAGTWTSLATRLRLGALSPYSIPLDAMFDDIQLDFGAPPEPIQPSPTPTATDTVVSPSATPIEQTATQSAPTATPTLVPTSSGGSWTSLDIGTAIPGTTLENGTTVYVKGSGADIWGSSDSFRYVYNTATSDLEFSAKITQWNGSANAWSKGGLMIRGSTAPNAANILVNVTRSNGIRMQWRSTNGATSASTGGPTTFTLPVWLKLTKVGNTIRGYYSTDGSTWTQIGNPQTLSLGSSYLYGMAVTSHQDGAFAEATFDSIVTGTPPKPTATPVAPTPTSSAPTLTQTVAAPAGRDPVTCTGYPEPRVFLESQAWWITTPGKNGKNHGHIHVGTCFPYKQPIRGIIEFDIRVIMHDNPGKLGGVHGGLVDGGVGTGELNPHGGQTCLDTCTFWFHASIDTAKATSDGRKELRIHAHVNEPDGSEMLATTGWQLNLANGGKPVIDYRSSDVIIARGWYTDVGYTNASFESNLPTAPVSGTWSFKVSLKPGAGGIPVTHHVVLLDANFHAGIPGTVLKEGSGAWSGTITLDTRTLINGPHRLILRADADASAGSTNSGVLVIPFTVQNP